MSVIVIQENKKRVYEKKNRVCQIDGCDNVLIKGQGKYCGDKCKKRGKALNENKRLRLARLKGKVETPRVCENACCENIIPSSASLGRKYCVKECRNEHLRYINNKDLHIERNKHFKSIENSKTFSAKWLQKLWDNRVVANNGELA